MLNQLSQNLRLDGTNVTLNPNFPGGEWGRPDFFCSELCPPCASENSDFIGICKKEPGPKPIHGNQHCDSGRPRGPGPASLLDLCANIPAAKSSNVIAALGTRAYSVQLLLQYRWYRVHNTSSGSRNSTTNLAPSGSFSYLRLT